MFVNKLLIVFHLILELFTFPSEKVSSDTDEPRCDHENAKRWTCHDSGVGNEIVIIAHILSDSKDNN